MKPIAVIVTLAGLAGCDPGTSARMDFLRPESLYDAPFPSDDLRRADGTIAIDRFPNPNQVEIIEQARALIAHSIGFARTGGVFFTFDHELDPARLPDLAGSLSAGAPVFLLDVTRRTRHPVYASYASAAVPSGAPRMLSLVPLQGLPLAADAPYVAVVTRGLGDAQGRPLAVAPAVAQLIAGERPPGLEGAAFERYRAALDAVVQAGVPAGEIAALAAFTTGDPTAELLRVRDHAYAQPLPVPTAFQPREVFPDFCVYAATLELPDYQSGTAPYERSGGAWQFDPAGVPIVQRRANANLVVTVPRAPMPAAGYPTTVFIRTGAGGDRPLVDRGVHAVNHGPALTPGSGPAVQLAKAGFAGVSVDGPLGGLRNPDNADEQFLIFNFLNAAALRDNVRESAVELALLARVVPTLTLDASACPGASPTVRFDRDTLALMGHSMGATIAPLTAATEPAYRAVILSGASASYIENVLHKKKPLDVEPLAEILLDYNMDQLSLTQGDPALTWVQWAAEPSDPQVYGQSVAAHLLMIEGMVDHYNPPTIANGAALSLGLDLAGEVLDEQARPDLADETPLRRVLPFSGRAQIALPASGNTTVPGGGARTAVVVQEPEDGIEDGHEVAFQTEAPRRQYRCFLASFARGLPSVPARGPLGAPCD